jgi:hypothetical protein
MLLSVVKTASTPTIAAAMARMVSNMPRPGRAAATGAAAARGAGTAAEGRAAAAGAAAVARGAGAGAAAADGAEGAGAGPPVGPPGGKVGSLMVGAAEGLGGKLIRTVSFFGWTFPVSFFGGSAPLGIVGIFSAIKVKFQFKLKLPFGSVKLLIQTKSAGPGDRPSIVRGRQSPAAGGILPPGLASASWPGALSSGSQLPSPAITNALLGLSPRFAPGLLTTGPARRALFPRARDIHGQRPPLKLFAVE